MLGLAAVVVVACGGRLSNLAHVEVHGKAAILGAFALQLLIITIAPKAFPAWVDTAVHLGTYALAVAFVWANRRLPNLWIMALGGALNLAAIAANGGEMPASRRALVAAGKPVVHQGFVNSTPVPHAHLAFLGDVFSIPKGIPFANVFSVGDVLLAIGAVALLAGICGCPRIAALDRLVRGHDRPVYS